MAIPELIRSHTVWVNHSPVPRAHHLDEGPGSTPPYELRKSLEELAGSHGRAITGLHFRLGKHNDIQVFGSKAHFEGLRDAEAKRGIKYFGKTKEAPQELIRAVMDYIAR